MEGSFFPSLCIPTFLAVLVGIGALIALGRFAVHVRQARRKHKPVPSAAWFELGASLVALALAFAGLQPCPPDVRISLPDSRLNPAGDESPSEEYVCLVNREDDAVSLAGWELRDADERINMLPDVTLGGGAAIRVHPGPGRNSGADVYRETKSRHWVNDGGEISLYDDKGEEIDRVGYGPRGQDDGSGECGAGGGRLSGAFAGQG